MTNESESAQPKSVSDVDEQALAQIDEILQTEDPEFLKQMEVLKTDEHLTKVQIDLDEQTPLQTEIKKWQEAKGFKKNIYKILPFMPHLKLASEIAWHRFATFVVWHAGNILHFLKYLVTDGAKSLAIWIWAFIQRQLKKISHFFQRINRLSKWAKVLSYLSMVGIVVGFGIVLVSFKKGIIPKSESMFLSDFAKVSVPIEYDLTEVEPFYDNYRIRKHVVEIPKMVINLNRSEPDTNPMLAFDLYIECNNESSIVEIKDRMAEVSDLVQRETESMTYEQLANVEGKNRLREKIKNILNQILTTGRARRVMFKTFILKPL